MLHLRRRPPPTTILSHIRTGAERIVTVFATSIAVLIVAAIAVLMGML
jgi:hypothetical protein